MSACDCRIEQTCEHPMASASTHTGSSASSTSVYRRKYEVFLSFRGADTRHGFTDHLYAALQMKGISVFRDDETLDRGEEIHPGLKDAIKASQYAVVVISEKFAESQSCLFELAVIMECWQMKRLTVLPVFYHVDPSDVKNQGGHFGEALAKLENDPTVGTVKWESWKAVLNEIGQCSVDSFKVDEDPLNSCRDALKKVGNLSGWHVKARSEAKVVEEISSKMLHMLIGISPNISTPLVGIESQATEVLKLLDIQATDVEAKGVGVIGIYGMGGVGKTTLAKVIYDRVFSQFQAQCFITIKKGEIVNLQKKLIYDILSPKAAESLKDDFEVARALHNRLHNIRSLIVLDNVTNKEEVETLMENRAWFGGGSRIILTSRDRHLLKLFDANIHLVNELKFDDALQLFSLKAFKKDHPKKDFEELSTAFVEYAKGLPLALKVLGSFLYGRPKNHWKYYKEKLEACLDKEILSTLEISFEGLDCLQKELFLDIAYFFNGFSIRTVIPVLKSFGFNPIDLEVLVERSMLKITKNQELLMHDLLVRMGQDLEGRGKHDKCKRLWQSEDIIQENGMNGVITINDAKDQALCFDSLSNMRYLRMLKIMYPHRDFEGAVWYGNYLESKLANNFRVLEWFKFPFLYLSPDFQPQNLVALKLCGGSTKWLQFEFETFHALTQIDLSGSKNLSKTSDFPQVRNLEIADLSSHDNLIQVDSSSRSHNRVRRVELHFCNIFRRSSNLVSNCLSGQSSSEMLNLFDCRLPNEAFSGYLSGLYSLKSLLQRWKKFTRIPDEILQLFDLGEIPLGELHLGELFDFHEFTHSSLSSLWLLSSSQTLHLHESTIQSGLLKSLDLIAVDLPNEEIPCEINYLSSLMHLDLSIKYFTTLPKIFYQLPKLCGLSLRYVPNLKVLPKLPMTLGWLDLSDCHSLKMTPYIPIDTWNSNAISSSIFCPVVVGSIGYDGKPYKILFVHPQCTLWSTLQEYKIEDTVACGHVLEVGFSKWFNERCTNFFGIFGSLIYLDLDNYLKDWMGYALYIIYQVQDNPSFPIFICELEVDGYHVGVPLVFCVPELPYVGVNMAWVFIPAAWFNKQVNTFNAGGILRASIATKSLNVKVNECWTRVVWKHDVSGFYDALSNIYAPRVDLESLQELLSNLRPLSIVGPARDKALKFEDTIACGLVYFRREVRIPKWFSERSTNCFGIFRSPIHLNMNDYLKGWIGYALYIVYEVCAQCFSPSFVCQLEVDGHCVGVPLVFPVNDWSSVGPKPKGVWVFVTAAWFNKQLKTLNPSGILRASIATKSLNVKVNGCWTRLVLKDDVPGFYDALRSVYAFGLERLRRLAGFPSSELSHFPFARQSRFHLSLESLRIQLSTESCSFARQPSSLHLPNLKALSKLSLTSYTPTDTWNSNAISHSCNVVGSIGYDDKPSKILILHSSPLWSILQLLKTEDTVACGGILEVGYAKWFSERSTNFFGIFRSTIYLDVGDYLKNLMGYAVYIVYQVRNNPSFPIFVCELEVDGYLGGVPLVFCVPELPSVGVNGAWVFIPTTWFNKDLKTLNTGGILRASITAKSLNVKINGCCTHVVCKHGVLGFYDAPSSVYARPWDLECLQKLPSNVETFSVLGPNEEKSFWLDDISVVDDVQDDKDIGLVEDVNIVETQQLEMPRRPGISRSIPPEAHLYAERDSMSEDMTYKENQPKSPIALPRQEHLEMAELTDQDRNPHRVRRRFRVQRRRRDLPLQRDPSVGCRNEFVSSWQFWRRQFFLHGRRNSLAAVCLLLTAFALLAFSSWKISDLENELCPT